MAEHDESRIDEVAEALLSRATRGERPALDELIGHYLPQLRAFVRLRVGPDLRVRESESDIVQSVCRELVEDWDDLDYRGEEAFRGWLFTAALSKVREKARFHGRQRRDVAREAGDASGFLAGYATLGSPSRVAMGAEQIQRLEQAMDTLPEEYRAVVTLSRIAGLPTQAVADRIGKTPGATRMLLGRALVKLDEELKRLEKGG